MNIEEARALTAMPQNAEDAWWLYEHGFISWFTLRSQVLEAWPPSAPDLPGLDDAHPKGVR